MKKILLATVILLIIALLSYFSIEKNQTIKIGFLGGLSGKYSSLGHSLLQGAMLAFEEENFTINGKKIELIIKDDKQDEASTKFAMSEFKEQEVDLILGSATSTMTKVALESTNKDDYYPILFSASASSPYFLKKDDKFIRTQSSHTKEDFAVLSKHLLEKEIKSVLAIYDAKNRTYSKAYIDSFEESFVEQGGDKLLSKVKFTKDFSRIKKIIEENKSTDAILIIANSIDTAKLVQFLEINEIKKTVIGSSWAKGAKLLEDGGKYLEGMLFLTSFKSNTKNKKYLSFVKKYKEKFKKDPSVFSSQAYEAAKVIIEVLKKDDDIKNFKETLLSIKKFEGLQGTIEFDEYGDIKRDYILMIVKDAQYKNLRN